MDNSQHTPARILQALLDSGADEAQSEYDGRVYRYCTSCESNDMCEPQIKHTASCDWQRARTAIAAATGSTHE